MLLRYVAPRWNNRLGGKRGQEVRPGIHQEQKTRGFSISPRCRRHSSQRRCRTRHAGTSRRYGGGFAKQVSGDVQKGKAPTLPWEYLEIRLDENLNGLSAGMYFDANRRVAKINLVMLSVVSLNNSMGHYSSRFEAPVATSATINRTR